MRRAGGLAIRLRFFARSDIGRQRKNNEDAYAISEEGQFGVLCDGMGGHKGGEVASRLAVEVIGEAASRQAHSDRLEAARADEDDARARRRAARVARLASQWAQRANEEIFKQCEDEGTVRNRMGTTLAFLCVVSGKAILAHVGDSRIYRFAKGKIEVLTRDHTIIAEDPRKVAKGLSGNRSMRKYVTRALGTQATVQADVQVRDVVPDEVYVMCSDGLYEHVREDDLRGELAHAKGDYAVALERLIALANERGGSDNITVILAQVVDECEDTEVVAYLVDS